MIEEEAGRPKPPSRPSRHSTISAQPKPSEKERIAGTVVKLQIATEKRDLTGTAAGGGWLVEPLATDRREPSGRETPRDLLPRHNAR
jgi:hypothetical protein